jgi:hypothetical protein
VSKQAIRRSPSLSGTTDGTLARFNEPPKPPVPIAETLDPAQAPLGDGQPLALGEQLGQVAVVDPDIRRRGQLDDPVTDGLGDAVAGNPCPVAMDQAGRTVGAIPS